jgi:hypothetical protein
MKTLLISVAVIAASMLPLISCATTIDFEGLADSTLVGNSYSGLGIHFNHAVALVSGVSLNELDFPPHSGSVAVGDDGSPIFISFNSPVNQISAWFAHSEELTFTSFDKTGVPIGVFVDPTPSIGADELITLNFLGATSVEISSIQPGSYVFDDLTFPTQAVPDQGGTFSLLACALSALFSSRYLVLPRKSRRSIIPN